MEKNVNKSPPDKHSDDVLDGLFISPLEDSDSLEKMESEEAKILAPPPVLYRSESDGAEDSPLSTEAEAFPAKDATKHPGAPTEQVVMRFAGELKSIKQDLLSIKQHFEAMKKPQTLQSAIQAGAPQPAPQPVAPMQDTNTQQLLDDLRKLLLYLDRLLESLPEEKIEEFANSEYFNLYRHVFEQLGLS